jgi:heme o synthase
VNQKVNIQEQDNTDVVVVYSKLADYSLLVKTKLSLTVVLTAVVGYLIAAKDHINIGVLITLALGGFLVTAAANAINEVLEKDFDALMKRTSVRPLAAGRMKISEAVLFAGLACLIGVSLLALLNPVTAILGMLSFVIYAFVYTPLKRYSTIAVAIGAIPGALPVLLGCTAYEGQFSYLSIGLFAIQFLWQFPHFWSIGFNGFEDYSKAGYKLLPVDQHGNIERKLGLHAVLYVLMITPILIGMYAVSVITLPMLVGCMIVTTAYAYFGWLFHASFDRKTALSLMFSSFFYMPCILLIIYFLK